MKRKKPGGSAPGLEQRSFGLDPEARSTPGSLAMLAAMRRASSRVRSPGPRIVIVDVRIACPLASRMQKFFVPSWTSQGSGKWRGEFMPIGDPRD
jgi:hypothetical protein